MRTGINRPWTSVEQNRLVELRTQGLTLEACARFLDRHPKTVERYAPKVQPAWSERELQLMCTLRALGRDWEYVAQALGRSVQACKCRMHRHRRWVLSDPRRVVAMRVLAWCFNPGKVLAAIRRHRLIDRLIEEKRAS